MNLTCVLGYKSVVRNVFRALILWLTINLQLCSCSACWYAIYPRTSVSVASWLYQLFVVATDLVFEEDTLEIIRQ